ncbi:MAG: 4Fe-4S binding protein [Gemmatimonadales bacterium]|nr:4Fe-4S binding protein [Gemmatimonadales bacterium]NIN12084.1 4Fe-4S binding protein [Gemmatimonadales bacterium]NIR03319.1 4Fe-4S binding protein [Gemmatimonadales bacterium]NIS66999.1 4Fe-4S binding protein [Gemmatimonadales bacterium]
MTRRDLTHFRLIKTVLHRRGPQFALTALALGGFVLAIVSGLAGTPVGSRNFGIVAVWIAWWAVLMLVAVPLFGRGWCSICPIPAPGDWLQRGALLQPATRGLGLGRRWPRATRNMWLQNAAFAVLALFSVVILTQPIVTAVVLLALLFLAVGASLIFERRAFCRYLCPVGGFVGLYSQLAPVELRVKDRAVCAADRQKSCYTGNAAGCGCPWLVYPGALEKNTYCGLCLECLRTCPHDNIAVNWRSVGADLLQPRGRRLDEAFKALIMLGSAIVYAAVMLGPWGTLKSAAYNIGSGTWLIYALGFLAFVFVVLPGAFLFTVHAGRKLARSAVPLRRAFVHFAYALIPLGLAAWVAFTLSFVFANLSYVWPVLSDPMGWGWDLVGTAGDSWTPYLTQVVPALQTGVLLGGLLWSGVTVRRIALEGRSQHPVFPLTLPVMAFCLVITLGLLGLLVG